MVRWALWVAIAGLAAAGLSPAVAQRQGRTASCGTPDPTDVEQVFACMASYRTGARQQQEIRGGTGCHAAAVLYTAALSTSSGRRLADLLDDLPSCKVLAGALASLNGVPTPWSGCTDYPGTSTPEHIKACLDRFLPGYYGNARKTLQSLKGCADITQEYENALRHATVSVKGRSLSSSLPDSYQKPDCTALVALTGGKGSACQDYVPGIAHLQACLGSEIGRATTCPAIRQAYESKLIQAYGGALPSGYAALPCEQLAGIVEKAQADQAQVKAHAKAVAQEAARQRQERRASPGFLASWGLGGLAGSFLQPAFYFGLVAHGLLASWALFYASRKARAGEWVQVIASIAGLFTRAFEVKLIGTHFLLAGVGIWATSWLWGLGAVAAIVAARIVAVPLWLFGLFRNPAIRRTGPVDAAGNVVDQAVPAPTAPDKGRSADWT